MGAWDFGKYRMGMDGTEDVRLGGAILSIKRELEFNGVESGKIILTLPKFGDATRVAVKAFQTSKGLVADGEVGVKTATELFRKRIVAAEQSNELPKGILGKKLKLESAFDPAARGTKDQNDRGIAQINEVAHPEVVDALAYDARWSIAWAGHYIYELAVSISESVNVLKAARAAYNVGQSDATAWLLAGFPPEGGRLVGGVDVFEKATEYIRLIDSQAW